MKSLKKIIMCCLFVTLTLSISGCASDKDDNTNKENQNNDKKETTGGDSVFDDASCWTVSIDGEAYTFPMKYEEFMAKGDWNFYNQTLDDTLYPKTTKPTYSAVYNKTRTKFRLVMGNFGTEEINYTEGYVVGIGLSFTVSDSTNQAFPEIILPKKITFNDQPSMDALMDSYGKPNQEGNYEVDYWYEDNILVCGINIGYNKENKVSGFDLINYVDPEENN